MIIKTVNGVKMVHFRLKEDFKNEIYRLFTNGKYKIISMEVMNGIYIIDAQLNK